MKNRLLLPLSFLGLVGCGDALYDLFGHGPQPLRGQDAFSALKVEAQRVAPTDLTSVMAVVADEERLLAGEPAENDEDLAVIALRRRSVQDRLAIDESGFELVDFAAYGGAMQKQSCDLELDPSGLPDEYLIPQAAKIPVKNQGYRGTCAAFAGVGSMEYAALNPKQDAYPLKTLDLSEQRFYWLSKPDCRAPSDCGAGSWFGTGFEESLSTKGFPVPLEADCPYQSEPGNHETGDPQSTSCKQGAARVDTVESWCGLDHLIELLHRGYAVPVGSRLTQNWEQNEGLITRKDFVADGQSVHAGGHAYLIVGYRRLPKLADEGGLCFVVKNSWGSGWGVNGYACMTVGWMKAVGADEFTYGFPAVTRVTLADGGRVAVPDPQPDPQPAPTPEPSPEPQPEPLVWTPSSLRGPDDAFYQVEVAQTDGQFWVRASAEDAQPLALELRGSQLFYQDDEVGRAGEENVICTAEWGALCALRRDNDRLFVQFRDPDLRSVKAEEHTEDLGQWHAVPLGGRPSALFVPHAIDANFLSDPKIFLRVAGSEPLRLALRPSENLGTFAIKLMGLEVGALDLTRPTEASLCTGKFARSCRLMGEERLLVLPGNRRSGKALR